SELFLERYIASARHLEVQIFGDGRGNVIALGERDCSLQRRNQKVVEETPAPGISPARRQSLLDAAVSLGRSVGYQSAGTVEFIYDTVRDDFYFLEVNTRLQVEHPITEMVTGIDLVEWMVRTAAGEPPDFAQLAIRPVGAAMEVRIYAEDPANQFLPSPGTLTRVRFPADIRLDGWVGDGTVVSPHYDPMLAKLIVHGHDRVDALLRLRRALAATRLDGIATNLAYLRQVVHGDLFTSGQMTTRALDSFVFPPPGAPPVPPTTLKVLQAAIDQHLRRAS
ncbi:MAG TPA: urea carboxylase, partial [Porticoccaceae bacterium]|nr:urea carboxylase [Porticoccaceae bacterium]